MSSAPTSEQAWRQQNGQSEGGFSSEQHIRKCFELFCGAGVGEIRAFDAYSTYSGYFDNPDNFVAAGLRQDGNKRTTYVTLNSVDPALLAKSHNRVKKMVGKRATTTPDKHIRCRRWILIDCDPIRPEGIPSSDDEKAAAWEKALEIIAELECRGITPIVVADSANGYHLLIQVDLPNDDTSTKLVENVLKALDLRFSDERVKIDTGVFNASRITKLYGTTPHKGDGTADRPHRPSRLLNIPKVLKPVDRSFLKVLADQAPDVEPDEEPRGRRIRPGERFDIPGFLDNHSIPVLRYGTWNGSGMWANSEKWLVPCPWNGHTDNACHIIQAPSGAISGRCKHNRCRGYRWQDFREFYEPGVYDRDSYADDADDTDVSDLSSTQEGFNVRLPEFPTDALPPMCQRYVEEVAAAVLCPPELVGLPVLCAISGAVGYTRTLRIKYGWEVSAALYAAVVSPPGARKSPAASFAYKPLEKIQAELRRAYKAEKETFERQMRQHALDKKLATKDGKPEPDPPVRPKMRRCIVDDTTVEALAVRLEENPRGLTAVHDELTGFIRGLDQYKSGGKGNARQTYLKMWSNAPIYVDRKGSEEPVVVPKPYVTLQGGMQPAVLSEIASGRNGVFLDRFMVAYPEPRPAGYSENTVSQDAELGYRKVIERLWAKQFEQDDDGAPVPRGVSMEADAKRLFVSVANALEQEAYAAGFPEALRGPWGKFDTHLARLALIVTLARAAEEGSHKELVTAADMRSAIRLLDYFKAATRKVYGHLFEANSDDVLAADVKTFLTKNGNKFIGTSSELLEQLDSTALPDNAKSMGRALVRIVKQTPELTMERKSTGDKRLISLTLKETSEMSETSDEETTGPGEGKHAYKARF